MRRTDHPIWLFVHEETDRSNQEWKDILRQINDSARKLQISLTEKPDGITEEHEAESEIMEEVFSTKHAMEIISQSASSPSSPSTNIDNCQNTDIRIMSHFDTPSSLVQAHIPTDTGNVPTSLDRSLWGKRCFWCEKEGPRLPLGRNEHMKSDAQTDMSDLKDSQDPSPTEEDAITPTAHVNLHGHCSFKDLPAVLYRWSNLNSQGINCPAIIRAGLFTLSHSVMFQPKDVSEKEFLEYFKHHVSKERKLTPFISFFKKPLAPIHRGLQNGDGAAVFIIDTEKLSNKAFKAAPLVPLTHTAKPKYKGYGEYLIWGEVHTDAIVCTFTVTKLKKIAHEHPDIAAFLQLPRISARRDCTAILYNELADNKPQSIDGYAGLLEKFTALLGVPENLRGTVAAGFKEAWFDNFRGFEYQAPDVPGLTDEIVEAGEIESHASDAYYEPILPRARSASYVPPADSDSDDSNASSSNERREGEETEAEAESEAHCPRWDTPEAPFSTHDDSSDDDLEMPVTEFSSRRTDLRKTDDHEAWPTEDICMRMSIRWPALMFARGRPDMWGEYGM
ncbi:uncharacterized protein N7477_000791 [Penicillium maclennaniae]|uniref:uncharacterized protein n=1 Tax=Penicillium maclennaniae TaxID=1343394 RepID=UPI0025403AF5|nr:uncharacterized protein N7477_000791 [Penicillium maclennaniae]KAJ5684446.1 hypothetical protein N7477_000791 [Penicillium maclennaniae]